MCFEISRNFVWKLEILSNLRALTTVYIYKYNIHIIDSIIYIYIYIYFVFTDRDFAGYE
jgi:hypothetical protein